jgi:predicted nucleic acid-binding protein
VPPEILVDTSFIVEFLSPRQPYHVACRTFMELMAANGTTIYFNRLLEIELAETLYQIALKERHPRDWKRYRHDGRARRRANRLLQAGGTAWTGLLEAFSYAVFEIGDVASGVPDLMTRYGLASYDAIHASTAIESGVGVIVTLDTGFASLPQSLLTVYTNASRVSDCRRWRP